MILNSWMICSIMILSPKRKTPVWIRISRHHCLRKGMIPLTLFLMSHPPTSTLLPSWMIRNNPFPTVIRWTWRALLSTGSLKSLIKSLILILLMKIILYPTSQKLPSNVQDLLLPIKLSYLKKIRSLLTLTHRWGTCDHRWREKIQRLAWGIRATWG